MKTAPGVCGKGCVCVCCNLFLHSLLHIWTSGSLVHKLNEAESTCCTGDKCSQTFLCETELPKNHMSWPPVVERLLRRFGDLLTKMLQVLADCVVINNL